MPPQSLSRKHAVKKTKQTLCKLVLSFVSEYMTLYCSTKNEAHQLQSGRDIPISKCEHLTVTNEGLVHSMYYITRAHADLHMSKLQFFLMTKNNVPLQ